MTVFPRFFLWLTLLTRYLLTHVIYFIQVCRWKLLKSSGFHPNLHDFRCMRLTTLSPTFRVRGSGGQKATCQDIDYLTRVSASVSRSLLLKWYSKFCVLMAGSYLGEWGRKGWRICNLSSISRFSSTLLCSLGSHVDPSLCGYQTPQQQEKGILRDDFLAFYISGCNFFQASCTSHLCKLALFLTPGSYGREVRKSVCWGEPSNIVLIKFTSLL